MIAILQVPSELFQLGWVKPLVYYTGGEVDLGYYFEVHKMSAPHGKTDEEILSDLFVVFNTEGHRLPRSLSVGDIVVVRGRGYKCAPDGWEAL